MAIKKVCAWLCGFLLFAAVTAVAQDVARGGDVVHAVAGIITKVDSAAKTITVKTADGAEHVFRYTKATTVHAADQGVKAARAGTVDTYMAGKEGTHAIVHYTSNGTEQTAVHVDDLGQRSVQVGEGTVTSVNKAARTVTIKAEDGTESTYRLAKDATVDTGHGITKDSQLVAKKGEKASVHYTEETGEKIVHLFKSL